MLSKTNGKEIKIEDFISNEELKSMTVKERYIHDKIFLLNKEKLQKLTNIQNKINKMQLQGGQSLDA